MSQTSKTDAVTSAVAATAYGATNAASVSVAAKSRAVRKAAAAAGKAARETAKDAGSTAQSVADGARSVAGASKSRDTRKATTAAGRAARPMAPKGFSLTRPAPMRAIPKTAHQPPGAEATTAKTITPRSTTFQRPGQQATASAQTASSPAPRAGRTRDAAGRFIAASKDTVRGVGAAQGTAAKFSRGVAVANPAMVGVAGLAAASGAYNTARAAGSSKTDAAIAGATAAAPSAAAIAAPSLLGRFAPKIAAGLSKAATPLVAASAVVGAVRGGYEAYNQGKGAGAIAGRAALGAADALTFGLASQAYDRVAGPSKAKPAPAPAAAPRREDRPTGSPSPQGRGIATTVGTGQANKLASVPPASKPSPAGPQQKKPYEGLPRSSYTNALGESKPHTKAEVAAYEKRKLLGKSSAVERKKIA